jgi:hypothetical protein
MKRFIAMDIGCIECGESSKLIGIYVTKGDAENAIIKPKEEQAKNWTGEHKFIIFEGELND